jgi:alkylated DNA repair dioxygenase AlkB
MDLFEQASQELKNYLPKDGVVNYYGPVFNSQEAKNYFEALLDQVDWKNDELFLHGKHITTKRKVAWQGEQAFDYCYSNSHKIAQPFLPVLKTLKNKVEALSGESFNTCLLNFYYNGEEGMSWHSDSERELVSGAAIASLSFGAQRKFVLKHKITKETCPLILENGSLMIGARINLTFRKMLEV